MSQSFEEYLMSYHAENYPTLDDLLPEAFADWICEVDPDTIIELAEKWHKQELKREKMEIEVKTGLRVFKMFMDEREAQNKKTVKQLNDEFTSWTSELLGGSR